ncbi:hypothetical protein BVRB_8g185310 [Beta vulgaris subsp. vulgaris]|nr:hypothetical protein BVRB_8g185310 [Beta vulgaris subsp. vulgaris]
MLFCAPLFSIKYILNNDPYDMNYRIIAADTLQKVTIIVILVLWCKLSSRGSFEWFLTLFAVSTLTNTLLFGIPLLQGMYGESLSQSTMVQLSVVQCIFWLPGLLFLHEYRKARLLVPWTYTEPEVVTTCSRVDESSRNADNLGFDEERDIGVVNVVGPSDSKEIDEVHNGRGNVNLEDGDHNHDHNHDQDQRGSNVSELSWRSRVELQPETQIEPKFTDMLPSGVTTRVLLIMVWMKLIKNPNFFSIIITVTWSLISFR